MFKKFRLKRAIEQSKKQIAQLEQRRTRSQAALMEAILQHTSPDDRDVDFFNYFTARIEEERDKMHQLMDEMENLGKH
ncbi:MAG: hypothetical protein J6Z79_05420 [Clostridia bacterium]|nr:hypothetical protein [Clostridia bacterium]